MHASHFDSSLQESEPACYYTSQYLLGAEMALCLPGIGACPSSMGVLYSHYVSESQSVSTAFFASTQEGLIASCVQKEKNGRLPAVNEEKIRAGYGPRLGNDSYIHLRGGRKLCVGILERCSSHLQPSLQLWRLF